MGPINHTSHSGTHLGSFVNGDVITPAGVISAASGELFATWPEGELVDDTNHGQAVGNNGFRFVFRVDSLVRDFPFMVFTVNEVITTFTWGKVLVENGFYPGTHWHHKIYRTIFDRNLNIIQSTTFNDIISDYINKNRANLFGDNVFLQDLFGAGAEFYTDGIDFGFDGDGFFILMLRGTPNQFRVPLPFWFVSEFEVVGAEANQRMNFYPDSAHLMGRWMDEITLPDPVVIPDLQMGIPHANKKRFDHNPVDHPYILRHAGGFYCTLGGNRLASFGTNGQLLWTVALPYGPQEGVHQLRPQRRQFQNLLRQLMPYLAIVSFNSQSIALATRTRVSIVVFFCLPVSNRFRAGRSIPVLCARSAYDNLRFCFASTKSLTMERTNRTASTRCTARA